MILALLDRTNLLTDAQLIEKYKSSGKTWYAGELYKRYMVPVSGICMSYLKNVQEAEDAVMDIFEILLKDLNQQDIREFKPWIATVARHYCLKIKEKTKRKREQEEELKKNGQLFMESGQLSSLVDEGAENPSDEELKSALENLKEDQRLCIDLFYLQNKSYKEITEITGLEENKVKSYIQNGKRNLKIALESKDGRKRTNI